MTGYLWLGNLYYTSGARSPASGKESLISSGHGGRQKEIILWALLEAPYMKPSFLSPEEPQGPFKTPTSEQCQYSSTLILETHIQTTQQASSTQSWWWRKTAQIEVVPVFWRPHLHFLFAALSLLLSPRARSRPPGVFPKPGHAWTPLELTMSLQGGFSVEGSVHSVTSVFVNYGLQIMSFAEFLTNSYK